MRDGERANIFFFFFWSIVEWDVRVCSQSRFRTNGIFIVIIIIICCAYTYRLHADSLQKSSSYRVLIVTRFIRINNNRPARICAKKFTYRLHNRVVIIRGYCAYNIICSILLYILSKRIYFNCTVNERADVIFLKKYLMTFIWCIVIVWQISVRAYSLRVHVLFALTVAYTAGVL